MVLFGWRGEEGRGGDVLELFAKSAGLSVSTLIKQKIKNQSKAIFFSRSCVTTFIKIQTKRAATKLCEILKYELKTFKEGINKKTSTKRRHRWTNLKTIKTDYIWGFWKLVSLTDFQSSFLLFVAFDIMLRESCCLISSCDVVIYWVNSSLTLHSLTNKDALWAMLAQWTRQSFMNSYIFSGSDLRWLTFMFATQTKSYIVL